MISVARGPEPAELRKERRVWLARAILAKQSGKPPEFAGYDLMKDMLVRVLHSKCCYCEMELRKEGNPVEHFRPKAGVQNSGQSKIDNSRYWWLAWTWENLLFACGRCNTNHKKNQFPLMSASVPLTEKSVDVDSEQALLIDPSRMDPRLHIQFQETRTGHWLPVPVNGSPRGKATIQVLRLDEEDDNRFAHVQDRVLPQVEQLVAMIALGFPSQVIKTWDRTKQMLFSDKMPFQSVSWDVLAQKIPEKTRCKWGLVLPKLGHTETLSQTPLFDQTDDPPEFAELDEDLKLQIRALGDRAESSQVLPILQRLRLLREWKDDELARLLGRSVPTVQGYLRTSV